MCLCEKTTNKNNKGKQVSDAIKPHKKKKYTLGGGRYKKK